MQRCCSSHDEGVLAVSSTSSGRQLRKPDDHTCWGGETVPPTDDKQQNADAAWRQLKRPEHSTSAGTGERIHWDTGVPSHWAYTWHVQPGSGTSSQWSSVWRSLKFYQYQWILDTYHTWQLFWCIVSYSLPCLKSDTGLNFYTVSIKMNQLWQAVISTSTD